MDVQEVILDHSESESEDDDKPQILLLTLKTIGEEFVNCADTDTARELVSCIRETAQVCYAVVEKEPTDLLDPSYEEDLGRAFTELVKRFDVFEFDGETKVEFLVSLLQLALYIAVKGQIHTKDALWLFNAFTLTIATLMACGDSGKRDEVALCAETGTTLARLLGLRKMPSSLKTALRKQQEIFFLHQILILYQKNDFASVQLLVEELCSEMFCLSEGAEETVGTICYNIATAAYKRCSYGESVDFFKLCWSVVRRSKQQLKEEIPHCLAWSYYLSDPSACWKKAVAVLELCSVISERLELQLFFAAHSAKKGADEFQVWYYAIRFLEFQLQQPSSGERAAYNCRQVFALLYDRGHYDVLLQVVDMLPWHSGDCGLLSDSSVTLSGRSSINANRQAMDVVRWSCALYAIYCLVRLGSGREDDVINVVSSVNDWDADYVDAESCFGIARLAETIAKDWSQAGQYEKALRAYAVLHSFAKRFGLRKERPMIVYNAVNLALEKLEGGEQLQRAAEFFQSAADLSHPVVSSLQLYVALMAGEEQQRVVELLGRLETQLASRGTTSNEDHTVLVAMLLRLCASESDQLNQPNPVFPKLLDLLIVYGNAEPSTKLNWFTEKIRIELEAADSAPKKKRLRKDVLDAADLIESAHGSTYAEQLVPNAVFLCSVAFTLNEDQGLAANERFQLSCLVLKLTYFAACCNASYSHEFSYAVFHAVLTGVRDVGGSPSLSAAYKEKTYKLSLHILHDYEEFKKQNRGKEPRTLQPQLEELLLLYEIYIYIQLRDFPALNSFTNRLLQDATKKERVLQAAAEMLLRREGLTEKIELFQGHSSDSRPFEAFLFDNTADLPDPYTTLGLSCLKSVLKAVTLRKTTTLQQVAFLYHRLCVHLSAANKEDKLFQVAEELVKLLEDADQRLSIQELGWFADSFWNTALSVMANSDCGPCDKWLELLKRLLAKSQVLNEVFLENLHSLQTEISRLA